MINLEQSIPCPTCNNKIPFDVHQLLAGMKFVCTNCESAIGLAMESQPLVHETMEKFEEVKRHAAQGKV
jgi:DNA-directed RNA polymerase subunit RPC12/RpoP